MGWLATHPHLRYGPSQRHGRHPLPAMCGWDNLTHVEHPPCQRCAGWVFRVLTRVFSWFPVGRWCSQYLPPGNGRVMGMTDSTTPVPTPVTCEHGRTIGWATKQPDGTTTFSTRMAAMCGTCQCQFCGSFTMPIHEDSMAQYGEPVCVLCFNTSFAKDPTNDA